jgi:hypothetical protein
VVPRLPQPAELLALLFQIMERGGDIVEYRLIDGGKRLRQRLGQASRIGAFGHLRLTQLDEQIDQSVVSVGAKLEQMPVQHLAMALGLLRHLAVQTDRLDEPVATERGVSRPDQHQILPDALRGKEEPTIGDPATDMAAFAAGRPRRLRSVARIGLLYSARTLAMRPRIPSVAHIDRLIDGGAGATAGSYGAGGHVPAEQRCHRCGHNLAAGDVHCDPVGAE